MNKLFLNRGRQPRHHWGSAKDLGILSFWELLHGRGQVLSHCETLHVLFAGSCGRSRSLNASLSLRLLMVVNSDNLEESIMETAVADSWSTDVLVYFALILLETASSSRSRVSE